MNKEIFRNMGGWSQIFFLCFFAFAGYILAILLTGIVSIPFTMSGIPTFELMQSTTFLRIAQVISAVCIFLIPSFAFAYLFHSKAGAFLKTNTSTTLLFFGGVLLLMLAVLPFVNLTGYFNQQMVFPDFMASVENWMKEKEAASEYTISLFLVNKSFPSYVVNILIIAVLAGVAEEFFFRGCLQQSLTKVVLNKHAAIWITAFIFSAVHLQFYGFVPRLLLGALLGYLFVWSGSIWVPVVAHIINNAITIVMMQMYYNTPQYDEMQNLGTGEYLWLGISSLVVSCLILIFLYLKKRPEQDALNNWKGT